MKNLSVKQSFFYLFLALIILNSAKANELNIKPFIKGSFDTIKTTNTNKPLIITFWSENCSFCMKELATFGKLLSTHTDIKLISITTDPFLNEAKIHQILNSKNLSNAEKWVFADDFVERLYFDVERNWMGNLPLTYLVNKNNKITQHFGMINEQKLLNWLKKQSTSLETSTQ